MKNLFLQILDMSVSASILAAAVMLLRLLLKKAPKAIHCVLWAMVALRLLCPSLPESKVSLMPESHPVTSVVQVQPQQQAPVTNVHPPAQIPQAPVTENTVTVTQEPEKPIDWMEILSVVWLSGVAVMTLYGVGSYVFLRRKVSPAIKEDEVWLCDNVASPFILGIVRPRIYLPSDLEMEHRASVLAHEKAHLRRKDHWWKPLGFALLAVHWFNPVMWVAYILLCRDIEAACDEQVVKGMEIEERKRYSEALLSCAAPRRSIAACPLAFGEQGVKGRIKSVLSYKKPTVWIILAAVVVSIAVGVFFLTDPALEPGPGEGVAHFELFDKEFMTTGKIPDQLRVTHRKTIITQRELDTLMCSMEDKKWLELALYDSMIAVTYKITVDPEAEGASACVYYIAESSWDILAVRDGKLFFADMNQDDMDLFQNLKKRAMEGGKAGSETELELVMNMTIVHSVPSGQVFEKDCFYATDSKQSLFRVYCDDMEGLYEGQTIRVTYKEASWKKLEYPNGYPDGGWSPQYEITATDVEYELDRNEYVATAYFKLFDEPVVEGRALMDEQPIHYYAVAVTQEELDVLQGLHGERQWRDTGLFSSLGWYDGAMNVVVDGKWNHWILYRGGILTSKGCASFTQEESKIVDTLIQRAALSDEAQNYFTGDWLVYQQKTKR